MTTPQPPPETYPPELTDLLRKCLFLTLFLFTVSAVGFHLLFHEKVYLKELIYGSVITYANAFLALVIYRLALRSSLADALLWGVGANMLRLAILGGIIITVHDVAFLEVAPFLTTVFSGFILSLTGEISGLHFGSMKKYEKDE